MSFSTATLRAVLDAEVPHDTQGLLVAVSGGADSACLLAAVCTAAGGRTSGGSASSTSAWPGWRVRAVHVDHGLQPAAADLRERSIALCARYAVPLAILAVAVDVSPGASIEAAARDARYRAFAAELASGECLLTAHHREDQAETLLLQLLRGAGLKGLSAMPERRALGRGWHVRPLLNVSQHDLLEFGGSLRAMWAEDPMNRDVRFDRAYLRTQIWPLIAARWPGAGVALARAARHIADAQRSVDAMAAAQVGRLRDGTALSVRGLRALSRTERIATLRHWITAADVAPPSTARLTEALRQLLAAERDRLPTIVVGTHALRRYRERLFLGPASPPSVGAQREWRVAAEARVTLSPGLGSLGWATQHGGLNPAQLPDVLTVRQRRGGETLKPGPKARTQSVQHLCQSLGVLPWMRDALPMVYAGEELIAVGDLWLDARWCVDQRVAGLGCVWHAAPVMV